LEPERLAERLHPDDRHIMIDAYEQAIAGGPRYDVDYRVVRPDGETRYVHSEGDVTWDADGRPLRMFGTMQDITERKQSEERLARYRDQLAELASEQAALRRVATLVARGEPSSRVFEAVAEEAATLLGADLGLISRFDGDGAIVGVGEWSRAGRYGFLGMRAPLGGRNVSTLVYEAHRPVRLDDYESVTGVRAQRVRRLDLRSAIGAPITVGGRLWGVIAILSKRVNAFPQGTEHRLAQFAELLATAVANAETQMELTASRARIVATADETRRRIESDLHDGAQQQLVSLALRLRGAQSTVPPELHELADELDAVVTGLTRTLDELRELARGIHPSILSRGGLGPALRVVARRSAVPVELDVRVEPRPPEAIEIAVYYVVSEALANAVKHAQASRVRVEVSSDAGVMYIRVCDDGVGGASFARGSGLVGLKDRAAALGGRIDLRSEPGAGTLLAAEVPYRVEQAARLPSE
jgi:signal transduction histidine kinase